MIYEKDHFSLAVSVEAEQQHFDAFFEDVFVETEDRYGPIEEMNICDNLGDHLVGNVYIKVSILFEHCPCYDDVDLVLMHKYM